MKVLMSVACDTAVEYEGRLCILGTFDTISTAVFPYAKPFCSIAVQLGWGKSEEGEHKIVSWFANEDGKKTMDELEDSFTVSIPEGRYFSSTNHLISFRDLRFAKAGLYVVIIVVDGSPAAEVQLQLVERTEQGYP